jgi:hypothetical protein
MIGEYKTMGKKRYLYLTFIAIFIGIESGCNLIGSNNTHHKSKTFARTVSITYHGQNVSARPQAMVPDGHGGVVITGQFLSHNQGVNIFVARIDNKGELMWQKSFGSESNDVGWDIIRTDDGEFVVCGTYDTYLYLLRIDSNGRVIWQHKYQRFHRKATDSTLEIGSNDMGYTVVQAQNGDLYAAGGTMVYVPPGYYSQAVEAPSLLHVNGEGEKLWFKQYLKETGKGSTKGIVQGLNNNIIMVGTYNAIHSGIFSTTKKGAFKKSFVKIDFGYNNINRLKNGNFILGGNGGSSHRITISKVSANGENIIWSHEYGQGFLHTTLTTRNGGVIAAGSSFGKKMQHQAYFFKLDANGNLLWKRTPDFAGKTVLYGAEQEENGGFMLAGVVKQKSYKTRLLVIRTDSLGHINYIQSDLKHSLKSE